MKIKAKLKNTYLYQFILGWRIKRRTKELAKLSDRTNIENAWEERRGKKIDLDNPKTLNEKIQWLKLNDRKDIYTVWADKYACRDFIKHHFGSEYLVPLLFVTSNPKEINTKNIKDYPCVVKPNNSSGRYEFIRDPNKVRWGLLRYKCKQWLKVDYYQLSQEWQYKNIERKIVVEKMLLDKKGHIPNDYKLHFIEGKLAFVYCSIDREGANYRQIYSPEWELLDFTWDGSGLPLSDKRLIEKPSSFGKMLEIGNVIAKDMHYVRVDFYDVDGKLFCGEITLHHGGGVDKFVPEKYDLQYGDLVKLDLKNK